tara:strand:+ start:11117 stop:11440 length:324 start_codon:yes stop_codon:yes gene_type:complete
MDNKTGWISAVVACLVFASSGVGMYVDLKTDIAVGNTKYDAIKEDMEGLVTTDFLLKNKQEVIDDRLLKSEANVEGLEKTQDRLEGTMKEMLVELKTMNENIIKLGK